MRKTTWALLVVVALIAAAWFVRVPYYSEGPGPALDVGPLIQVSGHPEYQSQGKFVLTSVSQLGPLNPYELLSAWIDPAQSILKQDQVIAPGTTSAQENRQSTAQMDQSQVDATAVVLHELAGYPQKHRAGALVEGVVPGCPADGQLFPTDLVTSINGKPVADAAAASKAIEAVPQSDPVAFRYIESGKPGAVTLTRKPCVADHDPLIGVSMIDNFPFSVTMSSNNIGGPSAGLMWALGLYDRLTPGDLSAGRVIAGTGEIDGSGKIFPIGGVDKKILAAKKAGAQLFLVPRDNYAEAQKAAGDLKLIPVSSFDDALRALGGQPAPAAAGQSGNG